MMKDNWIPIKFSIAFPLIGFVVNLGAIAIDPYLTVLLNGFVFYFAFQIASSWIERYKLWTWVILGIPFLTTMLSAFFLYLICIFTPKLIFCGDSPLFTAGIPFFFGMTLWSAVSIMKLLRMLKKY
jgi:hypothetical protein